MDDRDCLFLWHPDRSLLLRVQTVLNEEELANLTNNRIRGEHGRSTGESGKGREAARRYKVKFTRNPRQREYAVEGKHKTCPNEPIMKEELTLTI